MTDQEGNRKIYLARGIQGGLETADYCPRRSRLNPESQMDFSVGRGISHYLFYYIIIIMPTVNKNGTYKKKFPI